MTDNGYLLPVVFLPSGKPAPFLLTPTELVELLRLEVKYPRDAIARMRSRGLRAVQTGKKVFFKLDDVLRFLTSEQARNPR